MKHKPAQEFPKTTEIKDEATQTFCRELGEIFLRDMRNIYDDLKIIDTVEVVSALPTAAKTNRGKLYLLSGAGIDTLFISIDTGSGGYAFKQITLT